MMRRAIAYGLSLCLLVTAFAAVGEVESEWTVEEWEEIYSVLEGEDKELRIHDNFRISVSPHDLDIAPNLDEMWLNILLMGTDTGDIRLNFGRSDALMIASIHRTTGEIRLSSIVRDLYVDIPGVSRPNRINAANAFGGPLLAIKTVNQTLDMNITYYCSINFRGYREIIDLLGGVELTLTLAEASLCKAQHTTAPQVLNGEQALAYSRIRSLDSNFGRNERQRDVLLAIFRELKNHSSAAEILSLIQVSLGYLDTNLPPAQILNLALTVFGNTTLDMPTLSLPAEGAYRYETSPYGQSVVSFDREATVQTLHAFIFGS